MSIFFKTKHYLRYKFLAKNEYSLHSPFMFDFFTKGLKKSCKNKDICFEARFESLISKSKAKRKFLFKAFEYLKAQGFEIIYVGNESFSQESIADLRLCKENTAIFIEGIYKERENLELWERIQADEGFKLCCDFFDFGVIFFTSKPLKKQNYILRKK